MNWIEVAAQRSLAATNAIRERALSLPCEQHGAGSGGYCWPKVGGLCRDRLGSAIATTQPPTGPSVRRPGGLEELAEATRRANRDARLRTDKRKTR